MSANGSSSSHTGEDKKEEMDERRRSSQALALFAPGAEVRVVGLARATQHNGRRGRVVRVAEQQQQQQSRAGQEAGNSGPAARIAVALHADGVKTAEVLSVQPKNLELLREAAAVPATQQGQRSQQQPQAQPQAQERTVKRDAGVLREFAAGGEDPGLLVLYHHARDRAFDCFSAGEYHAQMLRYCRAGWTVTEVVPRSLEGAGESDSFLVCLFDAGHPEQNTLCELAFLCKRQFCGAAMLVKRRCFACYKPGSRSCEKCHVACFCSDACAASAAGAEHKTLCQMVQASMPRVLPAEESMVLL